MSQKLDTPTLDTVPTPFAQITLDGRPYIALHDQLLSGLNSEVAEVMQGMKDGLAE